MVTKLVVQINWLWRLHTRNGNHGLVLQIWSVKIIAGQYWASFLGSQISGSYRMGYCGTGLFWDGPKKTMRDYKDQCLFLYIFVLREKIRERMRRRWFVWLPPRKMKGSSDDDSSSGNYDSALAMMIQAPTMTIWASAVFWFGVLFLFTLGLTSLIWCLVLFNLWIHQTKTLLMNLKIIS